jgi:hypothetical protein
MNLEITAIFCQCADFLISVGHRDDPQCEMNTAEIMTNPSCDLQHSFLDTVG